MGGRGSAAGVSAKGIKYGDEYKSLFKAENIRFIVKNSGPVKVPDETMSADSNRVYAVIGRGDEIKAIVFYDKSGKKRRQIDLSHGNHGSGMGDHFHEGYNHLPPNHNLTKSDKAYITKVSRLWNEYLRKD